MSALPVLAAARVRGVLTANNHVLDWEEQGLADTLRALDDAGVRHAGAGASRGAARRAAHVPCRGGATVALLGCCDHPAEWAADDGGAKPGVNLFDPFPRCATREQ